MTETNQTPSRATLGLTGLTSNAMALIAPGAFLWLTIGGQILTGAPGAGMSMWLGIVAALVLCLATAVAYAELSKLYPGAGSSYFFAEQAFLSKRTAYKWARVSKFMVGWASHLYYWVYPGVMVGVTAIIAGYMIGQIDAHFFSGTHFAPGVPSPLFMIVFCVVFAYAVSYIAYRGVVGSTGVNVAINVVQIVALLIFSCLAIAHRHYNPEGSNIWVLDSTGTPTKFVQGTMPDPANPPKMIADPAHPGKQMIDPANPGGTIPKVLASDGTTPVWVYQKADGTIVPTDASGKPTDPTATPQPFTVSYVGGVTKDPATGIETYNYHDSLKSVLAVHKPSYVGVQACIAILILVGFESVTSMGEEAKNAKRDIPKAVILSLIIQGGFCYLFEYFAANYYMNNGYGATANGGSSSAPIGDIMQLVGAWAFGSANRGWWFMFIEAVTVFLALIGTTLSCLNTGARVTYAMGRDEEVPNHFGILHGRNATPHRAVWTLATISVVIGIFAVIFYFCGPAAQPDSAISSLPKNFWYSFGIFSNARASAIPQGFLVVTLVSNFGTFMLYMMSCFVAVVAFHEHDMHNLFKHKIIPVFGLLANLACMIFYLVGPFFVPGMSKKEPYIALGVAAVWGIYGAIYFALRSKKLGRPAMVQSAPYASAV